MKSILLGATFLAGLVAPAWAGINELQIDATTGGSVKTLSIIQDDTSLANKVSATAGGGSALPIKGAWKAISINQAGGATLFNGSLKAAAGANATLSAAYAGGNNTHALTIGTTTAPASPSVTIAVTNTGLVANTITDTLDGAALTYNLAISGTGNTVTNSVSATGAITLTQGGGGHGITGDNNTVGNTVSGVASFTHVLTIAGDGNTITNAASNGGDKSITQDIASSGNTVSMTLDAAGDQSSGLSVPSGSKVNYTLLSSAAGASSNITMSNVVGLAGIPAVINVTQTAAATNATAAVTVSGGAFTMGSSLAGAGVVVYQNSASAVLNASVTANANGYTANFAQ